MTSREEALALVRGERIGYARALREALEALDKISIHKHGRTLEHLDVDWFWVEDVYRTIESLMDQSEKASGW